MRKHVGNFYAAAIVLAIMVVYACNKKDVVLSSTETRETIDVKSVKPWYAQRHQIEIQNLRMQASGDTFTKRNLQRFSRLVNPRRGFAGMPDWSNASKTKGGRILKVPLSEDTTRYGWRYRDVVFKHDQEGTYMELLYEVRVNKDYLRRKIGMTKVPAGDIRRYIDRRDFTGDILIYTVNGRFVKGRMFRRGQVRKLIQPRATLSTSTLGQSMTVMTTYDLEDCDPGFGDCDPNDLDPVVVVSPPHDDDDGGDDTPPDPPYDPNDPYDPFPPDDDPWPEDPYDPGVGNGGGGEDTGTQQEDPCSRLPKVNAQAANPIVVDQVQNLKTNLNSFNSNINTYEYGYSQNLSNISSSSDFNQTNIIKAAQPESNGNGSIDIPFSWNSSNGYTIGVVHSHPSGNGPSPGDIFQLAAHLNNSQLQNSGTASVDFYKNNASVTVITSSEEYVVTVKNWDGLINLYNQYGINQAGINTINEMVINSQVASYDAAIISVFGNVINYFKKSNDNNEYYPMHLSATNTAVFVDCNN
ncbi:MAG: hypothetical protein QM610_02490 [Chitinophagaceae bacterium]